MTERKKTAQNVTLLKVARNDIATVLRVAPRSISDFVRKGMPQAGHGKYSIVECVHWRFDDITDALTRDATDDTARMLREAQREKIEIEIAQLRGELLDKSLVQRVVNSMASIIAAQLEALGARMAGVLAGVDDPGEVGRLLNEETHYLRSTIAQHLDEFAELLKQEMEEARLIEEDADDVDADAA